jgi:hypothetical protein
MGKSNSYFRRITTPPVVATGRKGRTIWDELDEQLPRPTDFEDRTPSWEDA